LTLVLLLGIVVLILLNGFFVAAEFALVRARPPTLEDQAKQGDRRAALGVDLLADLSHYLSACQLGITLTSLGIGFLGEPAVADLVHPIFGESVPAGVSLAISLAIAYLITTALHITIGEQVPKIYAIRNAEQIVRLVARPLYLFTKVFQPFIALLNSVSNWILRRLGVGGDEWEDGGDPEEIKMLIRQSTSGGRLDPGEASMLTGVFHLHEQQARQIMTPAPAVVSVDISDTAAEAMRRCAASGHTRLVVTQDHRQDRVRGIAHCASIGELLVTDGLEAPIDEIVREAPIVPESRPVDELLSDLRQQRSSLAVVVDEYGRLAGIVTVEDILEEIVGEIDDETDPLTTGVRRLPGGDWLVGGHVALGDLPDHGLELPVDADDYNSVGGLVFGHIGRLPRRGDVVEIDGHTVRVESVRNNRIEAVRINRR
jgi:magnesium and cobalt exporter, CNNM family